jgi:hypothetical protein
MIEAFKNDFWQQARNGTGYYGLERSTEMYRYWHHRHPRFWGHDAGWCKLAEHIFERGLQFHPLLDIAFAAFARAEARLGIRFIPQRSNEERLTGHLISEIEAAIHLCRSEFQRVSLERYGKGLDIDFAYEDLSKGGHFEKTTGSDLAIVLVIDLPDRPKLVRMAAIQAKKLSDSSQIQKPQLTTIQNEFGKDAYYLFYDELLRQIAPPFIVPADQIANHSQKEGTQSFVVKRDWIHDNYLPMSLWLVLELASGRIGSHYADLASARNSLFRLERKRLPEADSFEPSRLAVVSLGRSFDFNVTEDGLQFGLAK